jgi:hypothetical protein
VSGVPTRLARAARPAVVRAPTVTDDVGGALGLSTAASIRAATVPAEAVAPRFMLARVTLAAAVLGAILNLLIGADPYVNMDSHSFVAIARALLSGQGFTYREPLLHGLPFYAFRSPGYCAFLALELWLGGVTAAVLLQGALQGVSAALLGSLAGRWAGPRAAWLAFAIRFLWPAGWFHAGQLMSEGFFEFTTILTVWLAVRAADDRRMRWAVAAGVAAGLAVLTRPVGLGCALAVVMWLWVRFPRGATLFALAALLAWLPWPVRNAQRLHAFVPLVTNGGITSWAVQSDNPPSVAWGYMAQHTQLGEVGLDRHFRDATLTLIRDDPMAFLRREGRGVVEYLGPLRDRGRDVWLHRFALLALLPALLWANVRRRLVLPGAVWVAEGILLLPIAVHTRYRFPTEWCVIVAAAIGLDAVASRWGTRRMAVLATAGLLLCVAFTLAVARG